MRLRVAEIDQNAVAHVPGDEAAGSGDDFGDGAVIRGDNLAQILGIEPRGECGRADQIAEHHRQLPPFGSGGIDRLSALYCRLRPVVIAQGGDRSKQFSPVSDEADADIPEIIGGQLRQHRGVDLVVAKSLFVLLQSEVVEPRRDIYARLPDAILAAFGNLSAYRRNARMFSAAGRRRG